MTAEEAFDAIVTRLREVSSAMTGAEFFEFVNSLAAYLCETVDEMAGEDGYYDSWETVPTGDYL